MNNLINKPTCFQSNKPTWTDLILTNKKNLFKLSNTFETGISDHHKLVSTIQKSGSFKGALKMKICRSYKKIELEHFNRNHSYAEFEKVFLKELNKYAPLKKKIIRHNIMLLWQKNCGRKFGCDQNSRINLTRETINVLTIAVILSEAFVIDSKYIKMTGLQNFH